MNALIKSIKNAIELLQNGHYMIILNEIKKRIYHHSISYGLKRDLTQHFQPPSASVPITIRRIKESDVQSMLIQNQSITDTDPRLAAHQVDMVRANIPTCYVATTFDDIACYMQWLMGPEQNDQIQNYFKGVFPRLKHNEALIEGAFMHPGYRGLKIMPAAMSRIAEKAKLVGLRWVITFVDVENIASLKGCERSGFTPYIIREERWIFFVQIVTFLPLKNYTKTAPAPLVAQTSYHRQSVPV